MTRTQAIGLMLIALGLAYAVGYAGWVRRQRRHRSAGGAVAATEGASPGVEVVSAMGDYEGTVQDRTGERVTTAGLGTKGPATLLVRRGDPEHLVAVERSGQEDLAVSGDLLVGAHREQGSQRRLGRRQTPALRLSWRGESGGPVFTTTFRPRFEADLDRVESALWWHAGGSDLRDGKPTGTAGSETGSSSGADAGDASDSTDSTDTSARTDSTKRTEPSDTVQEDTTS